MYVKIQRYNNDNCGDATHIVPLDHLRLSKDNIRYKFNYQAHFDSVSMNITETNYNRLSRLMFKTNEEEANKINHKSPKTDIWEKKDLELLEGTEI